MEQITYIKTGDYYIPIEFSPLFLEKQKYLLTAQNVLS